MSRSMWRPLLRAAVSAGLVILVVASVDRDALAAAVARIDPAALWPAVLLIWSTTFVSAWRWSIVIRSFGLASTQPPTYWRLWRLYWIGQFFNQLLPSGLGGDGVRMWLVRRAGLPVQSAVTSVVVDRIVALAAIALLVAVVLPFAFDRAAGRTQPQWLWVVVGAAALGVVGLAALGKASLPRALTASPVIRGIQHLGVDFWKLVSRPDYLAGTIGASVAVQVLGALAVYAIAGAVGVELGLLPCLALMPIVVLATAVPISIAGWGVREVAMVAVLATVGVTTEKALLISLLYGVIAVMISLPGGVLWLVGRRTDGPASASPRDRPTATGAAE